jgi:thiol oxidase
MSLACPQVESKYGHSSTGDPAFPKVQWPTAADCPLCRLPQPSGPSTASKTDEAEPVQWNSEEVYRYLMQQYGRQPDDAHSIKAAPVSTQRIIDGGSAIMQAALEADEAAKATAGPFRWLTTTAGMCTLLLVAVALVGVMRHVGSGGRSSGMKGAQRYMNGRHGRGAVLRIRAGF